MLDIVLDNGRPVTQQEVENLESKFQVDLGKIESIAPEQQNEELWLLAITVYDQNKFEEGILGQVDDAIEKQERQKASKRKYQIRKKIILKVLMHCMTEKKLKRKSLLVLFRWPHLELFSLRKKALEVN